MAVLRSRRPHLVFRLCLVALALGCLPGCGRESNFGERDAAQDVASPGDVSEHLHAIGYVDFDEDADANLSGVTFHLPDRVVPGLNLYTNDVDTVILMDAEGVILREWKIPGMKHCEHVELIRGLRLAVVCEAEALVVIEADGETVFRLDANVHHDVAQKSDGSLLVLARDRRHLYRGRIVQYDGLLEVSLTGRSRWVWRGFEARDALRERHGPGELDDWASAGVMVRLGIRWVQALLAGRRVRGHEYYHINAVEVLRDNALASQDPRFRAGNVMLGLRNANTAAILDRDSWEPVWHWGEGVMDLPHMPTLLEDGRLLVFDNGTKRQYTRILEVDPVSKEIVWRYPAKPDRSFFSEWRGSAQRLPGGNTLICLSEAGRVIEIDGDGNLVWEFWNPEFTEEGRKRIYRFTRIAPGVGAELLAARR